MEYRLMSVSLKDYLWNLKWYFKRTRKRHYPSSVPLVTGDDFRNVCDFSFDDVGLSFLPYQVFEGAKVFVKAYPSFISYFFETLHPKIRKPYYLITHNQDYSLPNERHISILENPKLLHWFSTNVTHLHPKLSAIPIGVLNRRAAEDTVPLINHLQKCPLEKSGDVYLNFHIGDEKREREGYRRYRQGVYDCFKNKEWVTVADRVSKEQYLKDIARHRFVVSPNGHGPDCYRHWEAMYLGSIPIVEKSVAMQVFADYPMLLIDDWSVVNPDFLEQEYVKIKARPFEREKLYWDYWEAKILSHG